MPSIRKTNTSAKPNLKASSDISRRILELDANLGTGIKINIYGLSGTGKTTLWATFPKPILCLVCSGSKSSGELRSINTKEYRKSIKQLVINHRDEIPAISEYIEGTDEFSTVVLDHVTGLQDITLRDILGLESLPPQASWGMARQQDWGQCSLQMKESLRSLLGLSTNVVIVGQERSFNTSEDGNSSQFTEFPLMPFVATALTPSTVG